MLGKRGKRELVEIKLTTAPSTQDLAKLRKIQSLIGADRLVLLSRSKDVVTYGATWMTDLRGYLTAVGEAPRVSAGGVGNQLRLHVSLPRVSSRRSSQQAFAFPITRRCRDTAPHLVRQAPRSFTVAPPHHS